VRWQYNGKNSCSKIIILSNYNSEIIYCFYANIISFIYFIRFNDTQSLILLYEDVDDA